MMINNQIIKLVAVVIAGALVSACDADFDNAVQGNSGNSGTADLSKFVTIGDSLTAGYADNSLYLAGQENSYPAILAQQFVKVGGDANFTQPLVSDDLGGLLFVGNPHPDFGTRYVLDLTDPTDPSPGPIAGTPTTEVFSLQVGPFSNMGVPGAKSFHLGAPGYGDPAGLPDSANPYFIRFASSTGTTVITDAATQLPSFFVLWIGNNDVLSYATTGGIGADQLGSTDYTFASYGSNDITDPVAFGLVYGGLVGALTANPATQGVLVNIPDVSTIPYFTTVPYNPIPFDPLDSVDVGTVNYLNTTAYAPYNAGLALAESGGAITAAELAKRTISFATGQNAVVIEDEYLTPLTGMPSIRQATAADLLVLTSSTKIGTEMVPGNPATVWGVGVPLEDGDVLIPEEIALVGAATTAFNATIQLAADANPNLIFVDAAAVMNELSLSGFDYGTGFIDDTYATGGGFSLDGVHPTARGYSVIANTIIDAINTGFDASIPVVNPGDYTTIFVK